MGRTKNMMHDMETTIDVAQSLVPAARTASANGTGVDLANYGSATVVIDIGTVTDGTHTPKVQESDDNSTYTDVAAGDLTGAFTAFAAASDLTVQKVGYVGIKRYIRAVVTVAGATTGGVYSATVVRGMSRVLPK
jgi:hypothetical protein